MIQQSNSGHISRQNYNSNRYRHPKFTAALFTIDKSRKQPKGPLTEEGVKKRSHRRYDGRLQSHEKEQNNAICSNVDATRDYHTSEESQTETSSHVIYVESKTGYINEPMKQKQAHKHRGDLWLPRGWGRGWWSGNLGLVETLYYVRNGWMKRSYCIAQGTIFSVL